MVLAILPVYAVCYGWRNFLWFSDIALIGMAVALWTESALLASMMAIGVLLPELLWSVSFLARLLFGIRASDLAGYMFDPAKPRYLRALSLKHEVKQRQRAQVARLRGVEHIAGKIARADAEQQPRQKAHAPQQFWKQHTDRHHAREQRALGPQRNRHADERNIRKPQEIAPAVADRVHGKNGQYHAGVRKLDPERDGVFH